ncbi:MAG: PAS domain S-box protein [Pseudomonadota bacterium]
MSSAHGDGGSRIASENPAPVNAALNATAANFESLVSSVRDYAIFLLDLDGRVASWNAGAERSKGYQALEIIGQHFSCFYSREDIEAGLPDHELRLATQNGCYEDEGWRLRKDGSRFWARVSISALRDPTGKLVGFGKVTRDLTERVLPNEQFRLAIEATPTGMMMINPSSEIVLVNTQLERLFGYSRQELLGKSALTLVPELPPAFLDQPPAIILGAGLDLHGLRKDNSEVPVEVGLNPLHTSEGDFLLSSVVDITERKRAEREREALLGQFKELNAELEQRVQTRTADLSAALQEREVLLQEVHHRVKNNLHVIASLMEMQARSLPPGGGHHALQECQGRVHAIALIHEKLYQSKNYAEVPFADYIRGLASEIFLATGVSPNAVSLKLAVGDVTIAVDTAIPCGLILNELITNALKHAFPGGRHGTIRVELARVDGGRLRLRVADDGIGFPEGFEIREQKSLGLRLIGTLAKQLDATLSSSGSDGAAFELTFPVET